MFASCKLTLAEACYTALEQEALANKWAVEELYYYLVGHHFTLITDHALLQWRSGAKDSNSLVTRCFFSLQDFLFQANHVEAQYADGLSRKFALLAWSCRLGAEVGSTMVTYQLHVPSNRQSLLAILLR